MFGPVISKYSAIDHKTVTRRFKKFFLGYKNLNLENQIKLSRSNSLDSEAVPQIIEANLARNPWRVSGKLGM